MDSNGQLIYGQHHYVDASQPAVTSLPASGVLFNLLDEQKVGVVPLIEIERKWNDDAVPNLPGVLEALRDLSPANQMISFEIFDWSLRVAYSRAQRRKNEEKISKIEHRRRDLYGGGGSGCVRPPTVHQGYPRTLDGYRAKQQAKDGFYNKRDQPHNNNNKPQIARPQQQQQQQQKDNNTKQAKPTTTMTDEERAMNLARLKEENDRLLQRLTTANDKNEETRTKPEQQQQQQQLPTTNTKSKRRRTRSGPAITSKIIASLKRNTQTKTSTDKKKETTAEESDKIVPIQQQQQQQQKCSSSGSSSGRGSITPPLSSNEQQPQQQQQQQQQHDSNNLQTPNRLFVDLGSPTAKPISLKGKTYIGVTGMLPRHHQHQYNHPPKTSTPNNHPSVTMQQHHVTLGRRRDVPCVADESRIEDSQHRSKILAKMKTSLESRSPYFLVTSSSGRPKSVDPDTKQPLGGVGGSDNVAMTSPYGSPKKKSPEEGGCSWKGGKSSVPTAAAIKSTSKRRNPRRYTLSNDIDVAQLTRVRKLQQESEVLHETMQELEEVVDRLKRRHNQVSAHVRQHADGEKTSTGKMEHTSEDRMQLLANTASDLTEISRDLLYPNATDLKCKIVQQQSNHKDLVLRESNKRLKELLHDKCGRIKVLEEEKMLLIQQLFQLKSVGSPNQSSIFI